MPKMLFSNIRFYDINEVKRPKRFDFILNRKPHKDDSVECILVRKMNDDTHWKRLSLKPGSTLEPSLEQLLKDKVYQCLFRSFLQSEFSEENLDFWLACEDFRTIHSEEELQRRAQQIYQEFLHSTAKREVNVDHWIREQILRSLDKPSASCFREAQKHVYTLMEKDSWPRYTKVTHSVVHLGGEKPGFRLGLHRRYSRVTAQVKSCTHWYV